MVVCMTVGEGVIGWENHVTKSASCSWKVAGLQRSWGSESMWSMAVELKPGPQGTAICIAGYLLCFVPVPNLPWNLERPGKSTMFESGAEVFNRKNGTGGERMGQGTEKYRVLGAMRLCLHSPPNCPYLAEGCLVNMFINTANINIRDVSFGI